MHAKPFLNLPLQGMYTFLFGTALYLLYRRQQRWLRWHICTMVVLYALATVHVILFLRTATSKTEDEWNKFDFGGATVFIIIKSVQPRAE
jgi:cell shape-determining protein MreD